jgi:hypothetical protein
MSGDCALSAHPTPCEDFGQHGFVCEHGNYAVITLSMSSFVLIWERVDKWSVDERVVDHFSGTRSHRWKISQLQKFSGWEYRQGFLQVIFWTLEQFSLVCVQVFAFLASIRNLRPGRFASKSYEKIRFPRIAIASWQLCFMYLGLRWKFEGRIIISLALKMWFWALASITSSSLRSISARSCRK